MPDWLQLTYESKNKSEPESAEGNESVEPEAPDNWLLNNNPLLSDIPIDQVTPQIEKESHIHIPGCSVKFAQLDGVFFVKNQAELIPIQTGDVIETEEYLIKIQVNKELKPRQTDTSVFGMQAEALPVTTEEVRRGEVASPSFSGLLPQVKSERDSMNPLSFLGDSAKQPVDSWASSSLLVGMDGILDPSCEPKLALPNATHCLQAAFEGSVYKEPENRVAKVATNSVLPFKNPAHACQQDNGSLMYEDMQKKKLYSAVENGSPFDEIDQMMSENYDKSLDQHQVDGNEGMGESWNSQDSTQGTDVEPMGEAWLYKIKRKLWS